jgi:hypothetical protein
MIIIIIIMLQMPKWYGLQGLIIIIIIIVARNVSFQTKRFVSKRV